MKLTVVGLGYIGLPTAVMFAKHGQEVIGIDVDKSVIENLSKGILHLEEPGLQEELTTVINNGKFRVSCTMEKSDVFIISVPTPNLENPLNSCDLSYVKCALESVLEKLEKENIIIVESTIPPRTMIDVVKPEIEAKGFVVGKDIFLVHCPERVLPGQIMHELIYNNRIIGGVTEKCIEKGREVYSVFVKGELLETDSSSAELSKLMENTYRDTNIALANELVKVCNDLDINALEVLRLANKHPRVNLHSPGPGVGGHCLAVDPYFITSTEPHLTTLIQEARKINSTMPYYIVNIVEKIIVKENIQKLTVLGATYKGDIDDIRESPALEIYECLKRNTDIEVAIYDPHVVNLGVHPSLQEALNRSDLALILVDHSEFKEIDLVALQKMNTRLVFDTKNIMVNTEAVNYYNLGNIQELLK
ncbi:nucleotide sugar dehydrogenase [Enterococcus avium]|uniref:nucleotide sugar dehydrogenase n=1 Tax=Enterococcus avium TaxID=33945 RepID=UPI001F56D31A|nr:nucleotide sugar dehydrogenase [Enterococcus avium]